MRAIEMFLLMLGAAVGNVIVLMAAARDWFVRGAVRGITGEVTTIDSLFSSDYPKLCDEMGIPSWLPVTTLVLTVVLFVFSIVQAIRRKANAS